MPLSLIPTARQESHYVQTTVLSGKQYTLRFDWIQRTERWTLGLYDADDQAIVTGIVIHKNVDLFACFKYDERVPPGFLFVTDIKDTPGEPGYDNFYLTSDFQLAYFTSDDEETF